MQLVCRHHPGDFQYLLTHRAPNQNLQAHTQFTQNVTGRRVVPLLWECGRGVGHVLSDNFVKAASC